MGCSGTGCTFGTHGRTHEHESIQKPKFEKNIGALLAPLKFAIVHI